VESSGRKFHGVVTLVQLMCVTCSVFENSDQFKGSIAMNLALGCGSLLAHEERYFGRHQQWQASFGGNR
jgi:hypothetical protein